MRAPTEIFEEVLDAWDDDIKEYWTDPGPHLDAHRAKAAAYREEFRQAMHTAACTREICGLCSRVSAVGFHVPDEIWRAVMGDSQAVACVGCFARRADEKYVAWDKHIQFFPVSKRTHREVVQGATEKPICEQMIDCPPLSEPVPPIEWYDEVPLSAPEQALADANPSTYVPPEPTAPSSPVTDWSDSFRTSFDANDWARAFVAAVKERPEIPFDEATMLGWFANALMRGWDEHANRMPESTASAEDFEAVAGCVPASVEAASVLANGFQRIADLLDDDDEFRRRRDESAERYTREDGSVK